MLRKIRSIGRRLCVDPERRDACWETPFLTLRKKWIEVPATVHGRLNVKQLLCLQDKELIEAWDNMWKDMMTGKNFSLKGWYHVLYKPLLKDSCLLDFGSGLGFDGFGFASEAARVTFADIVPENIELLRRIAQIKSVKNVDFVLLESFESFGLFDTSYDVILANGSLHHAPRDIIHREIQELSAHLKIGGRWLQLAYPKRRWERDGFLPFSKWGQVTDGKGTPWAEWYDVDKLLDLFQPLGFDVVLAFEYRNSEFIWFDLVRRS